MLLQGSTNRTRRLFVDYLNDYLCLATSHCNSPLSHGLYSTLEVVVVLGLVSSYSLVSAIEVGDLLVNISSIILSWSYLDVLFHIRARMCHSKTLTTREGATVFPPLITVTSHIILLSSPFLPLLTSFGSACSASTLYGSVNTYSMSSALTKSSTLSMNSCSVINVFLNNSAINELLGQIPPESVTSVTTSS